MNRRPLRVVVASNRPEPGARRVAEAIAEALASQDLEADDTAPTRPSAVPDTYTDDLLQEADAAVVLDASSYERAREAGVGLCAAVLPGLDVAWAGDLSEVDLVMTAHASLVDTLVRRGALADRIVVTGIVAPKGYGPSPDRAGARASLGVAADERVVIVPMAAIATEDLSALLIQLSLVEGKTRYWFDVGDDVGAADVLRRLVPTHGLVAAMFSETDAPQHWALADAVVGSARGDEILRAIGVGAPVALLAPGRSDLATSELLESLGVADVAEHLTTFAATLEECLRPEAQHKSRAAMNRLDAAGGAMRVAAAVREAWRARRERGEAPPRGLPLGLEDLGVGKRPSSPAPSSGQGDRDFEQRIDRELAELRKRL